MAGNFYRTLFFLLLTSYGCFAQSLPVPENIQKAYAKFTRDQNGLPGKAYWQNTAEYNIEVKFNPSTRFLAGTVGIDYTNNSPDSLTSIVFKLYPNLYKQESMRNMQLAPDDLSTGVKIDSLFIEDKYFDSTRRVVKGTNLYVKGVHILPGQKVHLKVVYNYEINRGSFIRTGQVDSGAFFIAYFFPRVTVYDDVDGWNEYPYLGKEEFYNDYGNFHVQITIPANYQAWATGDLKNAEEVYTTEIIGRIKIAEMTDGVTDVITQKDLSAKQVTKGNTEHTWLFEASAVTDFAFAISDHYIWKSSSVVVDSITKRRTRIDAVFNPHHDPYLPVAGYARKTVELISNYFPHLPFPYSHETIFDGLDAMEYPMMVNNLPFKDAKDAIEFTAHEVFHSLFPFYVANNETRHSFLDEGWATFTEFVFHPFIDSTVPVDYDLSPVNLSAGTEEDMPVMTPTPQLYGKARFADKDLKPALAFLYLREMLGDSIFIKAVQTYIKRWAGKHPLPQDFFSSMNAGSGMNLNWFWMNWFFEKNIPDLAIKDAKHRDLDYTVLISSPGSLAVPIHLTIIYQNGSNESITKDLSWWHGGMKAASIHFKAKMKVKALVLGNAYDVDSHPGNNKWNF